MTKYVTEEILDNGNLKFTLIASERADLQEMFDKSKAPDERWGHVWIEEVLDFQLCNGWEMVAPERIGALTEAPIITNCLCEYSEDDPEYGERDFFGHPKIKSLETVWWYPNYMVSDPVEELLRDGYVIFTSDKNS